MAASLGWYPLVGLVLGACTTLPLFLGLGKLPMGHLALIQACLCVLFQLIATRALHWDGLADCFDAWGSGQRGPKFQAILKDSRIGAFGVLAIGVNLIFQVVALSLVLAPSLTPVALPVSPWWLLILAPFAGRVSILVLFELAPVHPASTLGSVLGQGRSRLQAVLWTVPLMVVAVLVFGLTHSLAFFVLLATTLALLVQVARREGGLNGDFLGCASVLTETIWFMAAVLF